MPFNTANMLNTIGLDIKLGSLKKDFDNTQGYALYFKGAGKREFSTKNGFDTRNGGSISFKMIYGNDHNGGEELDISVKEQIELHCSTDAGASWKVIKKYTGQKFKAGNWETISESLAGNVCQGSNVLFKLTQNKHSGTNYDHWAIDSFVIKTSGPFIQ